MAQIYLNPGEAFTVFGGPNTFSGSTTDGETVFILGGVNRFTSDFSSGGDRIVLSGSVGQYSVLRSESSIILRGPNGTVVTFPAPNPDLPDAMNPVISFTAGIVRDFMLDSTDTGTITLGGTVISTSTPVVIGTSDPIIVDVGIKSGTYRGGEFTYTFTLAGPRATALTLDIATIGGTAIPDVDFGLSTRTVTFAPFQTVQEVNASYTRRRFTEPSNSLVLQLSSSDAVIAATGYALAYELGAPIIDETSVFSRILTIGTDTYSTSGGTYYGALQAGQTGKLLSANDRVEGGPSYGLLRIVETDVGSVIDDVDFSGTSAIGVLETNFTTIHLGAQADRAGLNMIDTQGFIDSDNISTIVPRRGNSLLDLAMDANGDGRADFDNALTAFLANSGVDTVRLMLQASGGSAVDTGMTFKPRPGDSIGPIDIVEIVGAANPVRITVNPAGVGNGTPYEIGTQVLSTRAQATDTDGNLIGSATRFDDEGIRFTGARFTVDDGIALHPGFGEVILGTGLADTLAASTAVPAYIVGGLGNDRITGGAGADVLIGGSGADVFAYAAASQSHGSGYDMLPDFAFGSDAIDLPGAVRTVARIAAGPLNATSLDGDLTALLATSLSAGGAALVTAVGGTLTGATFLIADGNGVAGYQAGGDFVIRLPDPPAEIGGLLVV